MNNEHDARGIQNIQKIFGNLREGMSDKSDCCISHKIAVALAKDILDHCETKLIQAAILEVQERDDIYEGLLEGLINCTSMMVSLAPVVEMKEELLNRTICLFEYHSPEISESNESTPPGDLFTPQNLDLIAGLTTVMEDKSKMH